MFALSIILLVVLTIAAIISLYNNTLFKEKTVKIVSLVLVLLTLLFQVILENDKNYKEDESRKIIEDQKNKINSLTNDIDSIKRTSFASISLVEKIDTNVVALKNKKDLNTSPLISGFSSIDICQYDEAVLFTPITGGEKGQYRFTFSVCNLGKRPANNIQGKATLFIENENKNFVKKLELNPQETSSTVYPYNEGNSAIVISAGTFIKNDTAYESKRQSILAIIDLTFHDIETDKTKTARRFFFSEYKLGNKFRVATKNEEIRALSFVTK